MSSFSIFVKLYNEGKIKPSTMAKAATFKEELEKNAGADIGTFLRYLATGLAVSSGLGLAAAGAQLSVKAFEDYKLNSEKDDLFKEVVKVHPDLAQSRERAKLYFNALLHFSPVVARNPLTAGAYIKQALQYDHVAGGPLPQSIKELSEIQRHSLDAHKNAPKSALGTVLSGVTEAPTKILPSFMNFSDFSS
jgi:hypothetical protein